MTIRKACGSILGIVFAACSPVVAPPPNAPCDESQGGGRAPGGDAQASAGRGTANTAEALAPSTNSTEARVRRLIKEQLDVDEKDIRLESTFIDDLGADSLGLVELVLAFEEEFTLDIPDEDTEKIRTVADAIRYVTDAAQATK